MTITATADVGFVPPRVEVDVSVPAGNVMTAVNVWRNDSTGRSLVRSQPSAGFESRTVYDYECPFGQSVTYDWAVDYYDPTGIVDTFTEPWSSFPGSWTGDTGSGSIASNRVTLAGSTSVSRSITRTGLTAAWDLISVDYLDGDDATSSSPRLRFDFSTGSIRMSVNASGNVQLMRNTTGVALSGVDTGVPASAGFLISKTGSTITISDGVASYTYTATLGTLATVTINAAAQVPAENAVVGAITAGTLAGALSLAEESDALTLAPADAWLVAPQAPALSVPLSNSDQQAAGIRTLGPISNASNTTVHRILGASEPVTTTTGNRQSDTFAATVYTHTSEERQALKALLAADTPILINVPPAWDIDLDYGFYQVGDVTETRFFTLGGVPMRDFQLPLTRVRSPEVDVENPGWSYSQVATTWATYTDLLNNYATYADLAQDNRS